MTRIRHLYLTHFLINDEVVIRGLIIFSLALKLRFFWLFFALFQQRYQHINILITFGRILNSPGNNKRCTRFIDQNGIHFVDDGKTEIALEFVLQTKRHVVAQVIKPIFVVGTIGDIGSISSTFFFAALSRHYYADSQSQKLV